MSRLRRVNSIVVLLKNPISAKYKKAWILTMEFPELSLAPSKRRPHPPRARPKMPTPDFAGARGSSAAEDAQKKRERERTNENERAPQEDAERERTND
jgi:hypothetical protein